jgi:hypothetical protein
VVDRFDESDRFVLHRGIVASGEQNWY